MPIKIALRTGVGLSPFRRLLLHMLHPSTGDSALICSGYIWEPKGGKYQVLADNLLKSITLGCPNGVITVAGKLGGGRYRDFYTNFVSRISAASSITAYTSPLDNWHAKIAIRLRNGVPVAGIIGSSNLTGPAYGENRPPTPYTPGWNYEADTLIWVGERRLNKHFNGITFDMPFGFIDAVINPRVQQLSEGEQLQRLYDHIMQGVEQF